ncbi:MAG TPA: M50 family metallopeptidase [Candidatus Aminicenantes bacterium]|nr:M50 family metallopeptidase [Candidatus Aminicenantes bacterium]
MSSNHRAWGLAAAALLTIVIWRLPQGGYLLYPFTILATWFHETGHGLTTLLLGGSFHRLELFANGSGLALTSGSLLLGRWGVATVAAAGPLGPALAGALLIRSSRRPGRARVGCSLLALVMLLTVIFWIRSLFGIAIVLFWAALLSWIASRGSPGAQVWTVQFLGVQASISVFAQIGYLFTHQVVVGGRLALSDTGLMESALLLPYWFWAVLLTGLSLMLPCWSLRSVLLSGNK